MAAAGLSAGLAAPAPQSASKTEATASRRVSYRYGQRAPTRARYKEIQLALKKRGYNPGPIDGQWGSKTAAALKRFERDNKLHADGRLDSLALIILGLGPQRLTSVSTDTEKKTP
ncbi:MAG: peptidoglycan-binding protein [bacterium]|nr:peptidoglycan-binding protein [bacterium]